MIRRLFLRTLRLLDYQVREKLEPRESESDDLWRPASPVRRQSQDAHPHCSGATSKKHNNAKALLSALLGCGEAPDDPIVIDDAEGV